MSCAGIANFSLLSTTRYDEQLLDVSWNTRVNGSVPSRIMLLPYHFDRLVAAAEQHGWMLPCQHTARTDLANACNSAVEAVRAQYGNGPFRVRILLTRDGDFIADASPVNGHCGIDLDATVNPNELSRIVFIDSEPTSPSRFTSTKTTHRLLYNSARARVGLSPMPTPTDGHMDVLLYNPEGLVMETSIRNIVFLRDNKWVTPPASSGCLPGVMRRLMLEEGRIIESDVRLDEVTRGETVMTLNGVEAIQYGRLALFPLEG